MPLLVDAEFTSCLYDGFNKSGDSCWHRADCDKIVTNLGHGCFSKLIVAILLCADFTCAFSHVLSYQSPVVSPVHFLDFFGLSSEYSTLNYVGGHIAGPATQGCIKSKGMSICWNDPLIKNTIFRQKQNKIGLRRLFYLVFLATSYHLSSMLGVLWSLSWQSWHNS